jgi:hypothetical protein
MGRLLHDSVAAALFACCEHPNPMEAMADLVLTIHLLWILWLIFGVFWTVQTRSPKATDLLGR